MEKKLIWREESKGLLYLSYEAKEKDCLENAVYEILVDRNKNLCLRKVFDEFSFNYKIYGIESEVIKRTEKTYTKTVGNLGVIFNGIRGTGKSVSAKLICNRLKQPTIIVDTRYEGLENFLNSIPQNITIFVDEYEKIYSESNDMLTIMDGVMNSDYRRFFIFTTNRLRIEENLLQRPSRVRYLKEFSHLGPRIVEEIVDDVLINKTLKHECIQFIASLELITVDIVKAVLQEVNIHNESPRNFEDIFNVQKNTGKFNVFLQVEGQQLTPLADNVKVYPRPKFDEDYVGSGFQINGKYYGVVTGVLDCDTLRITQFAKDKDGNYTSEALKIFDVKIEPAIIFHYNYRFNQNSDTTIHNEESFAEPIIIDKPIGERGIIQKPSSGIEMGPKSSSRFEMATDFMSNVVQSSNGSESCDCESF